MTTPSIYKSNAIEIFDAVTLAADDVDTVSQAFQLDGAGATLSIEILNGATGPTQAAQVIILVSHDGTKYFQDGGALVADLGANIPTQWTHIEISQGYRYVKVSAGSNTDEDVVITAHMNEKLS